ncbi:hypothetical protein [Paraburkholderia sp. BL17N1]|uniref:hypothetical protein n=1 Tax=Paraburkholderia sp. BL17N1 TaxID=1938798 RepID=UPI000F1C28DC|nr:hypothetical protein [Paraburkholderia sp. BL17N1]RKR44568.1 hypothetical protein B0G82_2180 [Paraburkholderia sp. BL17N1]
MTARYRWTSEDVARRAAEHYLAQCARRDARYNYECACIRFKERRGIEHVDVADASFRRSTRKAYVAYQHARRLEYNAARRLETAIRGSEVFREVSRAHAR